MGAPSPSRSARGIRLRPIQLDDVEELRLAEFNSLGPGWRFAGATPSPQAFMERIWQGVTVQLLAVRENPRPDHSGRVGWFQAYNAEMDQGVAWIAAANFGPVSAAFGLAAAMFVDYLFDTFAFRKLYIETPESNEQMLTRLVGVIFREEGRLRDRVFRSGRFVDVGIYSISREDWTSAERRLGLASLIEGDRS